MRTYPTLRRVIAALLAVVALALGVAILLDPNDFAPATIIGITDILLAVSIILGIVVIRSHYDI